MVERCVAAEKERHALETARATSAADEARAAAEKERDEAQKQRGEAQKQLKEQQLRHAIELAKAKAAAEAELDARSQQFAADLRALNASYREARDELGVLTQQLREVRRAKAAAERALRDGLDHAQARQDDADARLFERSQLAVQLAGHASKALQQEMLTIFTFQDRMAKISVPTVTVAPSVPAQAAAALWSPFVAFPTEQGERASLPRRRYCCLQQCPPQQCPPQRR